MKMEQACRFRTDEAGYMVCARSQDLTADNENNLGYFNSTMTSLFEKDGSGPKMGQSILSYAVSEENGGRRDFLIAKSTMRSDIKGRASIFTHAYFMGLDEYARCMETDPSAIYGIDTGDMMTAQSGSQLPPKETVLRGGFELSVLREKYGLTDERYALLLYNVYQAVAGGGSLALLTQLPLSQTQDMVREVAYCAAMGMLPGLRWRLTCSSAADTRAAICVSSKAGGGGMGIPLCTFDLDDGGRRLEEDPFVAELFRYLASAAPEERRQMLLDMQYILGELVPLEYASLEMIATAYHMRKMNDGNRPENDVYDRVVGNLLLCGRVPSANQETVNKLLIWMLKRQNAALPKRIMELSVDRCVKQVQADVAGGRELCDCVCRLLQYSRSAEQLELLQKTVKTFDVRYAGLVHALLRGIFSDRACSIDPQTACSLIPEMLRSGDEMLTGDCVELTTCLEDCLGGRPVAAVIVGAGKLGRALLDYAGFSEYGTNILAAFDLNVPAEGDRSELKPVLPMSALADFCAANNVSIGIVTVPKEAAQAVTDVLYRSGVRAFWCFAPCRLQLPPDAVIQYENLALSLAHLKARL